MKDKITFLLIILLAAGISVFHYKYKKEPDKEGIRSFTRSFTGPKLLFKKAPDFTVRLLDGKEFKLSDNIKNKIIIINFFATWCGPCKEEIPELNRFYDRNKDSDIIMIGIDIGETRSTLNSFMSENEIHYPVAIIGKQDKMVSDYMISAYPTTVLIDYTGNIMLYEPGAIMNAKMILDRRIKTSRDIRARMEKQQQMRIIKQ